MQNILLIVAGNAFALPRIRKVILLLKGHYNIDVIGISNKIDTSEEVLFSGVNYYDYPPYKKRHIFQEIFLIFNAIMRNYNHMIYTENRMKIFEILENLRDRNYRAVFCFDVVLLPFLMEFYSNSTRPKIIIDLREYYPKWSNDLRFKILFSNFYEHLISTYVVKADIAITINNYLKNLYKEEFNINALCVPSYPMLSKIKFYKNNLLNIDNKLSETVRKSIAFNQNKIKIIYHGSAAKNRNIKNMLSLIKMLDSRFSLVLMLAGDNLEIIKARAYAEKLQILGYDVKVVPPVRFASIIPTGRAYDIGMFINSQSSMNLKYALPNKFFEYIASHLCLAFTPTPAINDFVKDYNFALISENLSLISFAEMLNNLDFATLKAKKQSALNASFTLNAEAQREIFLQLVSKA